jgi:regulator of protease activity HflC (stomatin/prohibitin superfamily)
MISPLAIVFVVFAVVVLVIIAKTAVVVPQQNAYIVERLGRYHATLQAGFHFLMPFVDVIRYRHSLKEVAIDIAAQVCITRDNVQVEVDGILYMKILDPEASRTSTSRSRSSRRRTCAARSARSRSTRPSRSARTSTSPS